MTSRVANDEKTIRDLLTGTTTWAVVGLSTNTSRPAYGVARFLQSVGKRIVPVHPRAETVHGEQGYRTLADIPFDVDMVDVFVNSVRAGEIADEAGGAWWRDPGGGRWMARAPEIKRPRLGLGR